jgi:hypothetical protein
LKFVFTCCCVIGTAVNQTLNFKCLGKFKTGFENILGYDLGAQVGSIDVKPEVEDITQPRENLDRPTWYQSIGCCFAREIFLFKVKELKSFK